MATKFEYYDTGADSATRIDTTDWGAQTFTPEVNILLSYVRIKAYRANTPSTITVSIQNTTAGKPDNTDLVTGTFDGDTLTTDTAGEWVTCTFSSPLELSADTMYAIVVKAADEYLWWCMDSAGATYTIGTMVTTTNSGTDWTLQADRDYMFETWGGPLVPADKVYSQKLVAVGNNEVWYESTAGTMSELAAANKDVSTINPLTGAIAFQKLFIANETNLKVMDFGNVKLSTADILPADKVIPLKGDILTGGTNAASMVVDYIDATDGACLVYGYKTTATSFVDTEVVTGTNANGNISFTLDANEASPPHWYDWTAYSNDTTTYGTMPSSAYIVARYRGRLNLAGHPSYPHQWYMSKSADPWDWLYSTNDPMTAVAGQNAQAGEVGDIIRALIPYGDDYMVIGCATSIFLLTGDPAIGGNLDELSELVGIYGPWAWCKDANGNLYFFSSNGGLYKMAGGRERPVNISIGALPKIVSDWALDPSTHRVVLSYDSERDGIIISKTTLEDGTNLNYWYSLRTGGFYPETYPEECGIYCSCNYNSDAAGNRALLLGCADGYIKYFKDTAKSDDIGASDEAISSYFTLAPFSIGDGVDLEGKIKQIVFESAGGAASGDYSDTDGFSLGVYRADDAETCIEDVRDATVILSAANLTGTISGTGRKTRIRQNVRGMYGTIVVSNTTISQAFSVNRILIDKKPVGRLKG